MIVNFVKILKSFAPIWMQKKKSRTSEADEEKKKNEILMMDSRND